MPFWDEGAEPLPTSSDARMVVDPDKILHLKKRLEDRRDILQEYLVRKGEAVFTGRPPGTDPCSEGNAKAFTANGKAAAEATVGFVKASAATINSLHDTAVACGLVEEANTERLRKELRK